MKKIIAILLLLATFVCALSACADKENIKLTGKYHSDVLDVYLDIVSVDYSGEYPRLNARWYNNSDKNATYPDWYTVERLGDDGWESISLTDSGFENNLYTLEPGVMNNRQYSTKRFDLSLPGTYRVRTWCNVGAGNQRVWAEFEVE